MAEDAAVRLLNSYPYTSVSYAQRHPARSPARIFFKSVEMPADQPSTLSANV
jgi:hypothetical protein